MFSSKSRLRQVGRLAVVAAFIALGGCTSLGDYIHNGFKVGPNYNKPTARAGCDWIDAGDPRIRPGADDMSQWWTVFNDPVLNSLICDAYRQNLTLREAGFRVLRARAQLGVAVGEFFPQYQVMDGGFTQKTVSIEVANRQATPERYFGTWDLGFGLSWELDFWGKYRRSIEEADDRLSASVYDYDWVLVTLLSDVATYYVQMRTAEQQLIYARMNVELQKQTLSIAKARFQGGQASELDVDQAQSNLSQTESTIPQIEITIRQANNRLCVLLGIPPEDLKKCIAPMPIPTAPPDVAIGIPCDLLRRRPDVRREERLAAARSAAIGVAEADFYPAISVTGQIGYAAEDFSDLFSSKAFAGSVGPGFEWKILNYGRILNHVRAKEAEFMEQVTKYQQTVLQANEEVENGLVTFLRAQQSSRSLEESVQASQKAVKVVLAQYQGGIVDFNRVALLEQNLVQQQNSAAQARGQIGLGLIQVYKGMGGGWELKCTGCDPGVVTAPILTAVPEQLPAPIIDKK